MSTKKKIKIFQIIIFIITIIMLAGLTIYLFPIINNLTKPDGREIFKNQIKDSGIIGFVLLFGLQTAQILLPVLPGEPIEILAGVCYGSLGGLIFIMISAFIITTVIFFIVRKLGRKFVYNICSKEKVEKIENSKLFKNTKKLEYIMLILFLIPGTPKDVLIYLAGILPINPIKFIFISTFARIPSIISSTIAGDTLSKGNWQLSIGIYIITFTIVLGIIFVMNKLDKSKFTNNIIKTIQKDKGYILSKEHDEKEEKYI